MLRTRVNKVNNEMSPLVDDPQGCFYYDEGKIALIFGGIIEEVFAANCFKSPRDKGCFS